MRRPAGLVLAGGGALGAWQGGVVAALARAGLAFDRVVGFSAGSLTGTAYFLNRIHELEDYWKRIDDIRVLRFAPKLRPFSIFSDAAVREVFSHSRNDEEVKHQGICELFVMSLRLRDWTTVYHRFSPKAASGWDGPLIERVAASCSIPWIFPPALIKEPDGETHYYLDGGIPGREWMKLDVLEGCKDVLCVEMVRPDEVGIRRWLPMARYDQTGREVCKEHITRAIDSLKSHKERPRVYRLFPSEVLKFSMLGFKNQHCVPAFALGAKDGDAFLKDPLSYAVSLEPATAPRTAPAGATAQLS